MRGALDRIATPLLDGLTPAAFLARYWHKRAHLIRAALPSFTDIVDLPALKRLAARDDVEARVVVRDGARWHLEHGPFPRTYWRSLPATRWTLLVQGLNHLVPRADALLRRFRFVPDARLDDVMVSYASPAGGVGPHVDSYDVFLLQGSGRRRWRISRQRDLALQPRAPLRILAHFAPREEWVLEPGDMLYLPPRIAHEGVALEACTTYSIGFRAPADQELAAEWLGYLQEHLRVAGRYADPQLRPTRHPAELPNRLVEHTTAVLRRIRVHRRDVVHTLGRLLTTPKAHVVFTAPAPPLSPARFGAALARRGIAVAPRTLMLYCGPHLFVNGEPIAADAAARATLRKLADERALPASERVTPLAAALLHDWYRAGWLILDGNT
jgi:50S ribosomal protein L16 3-hydroxylase